MKSASSLTEILGVLDEVRAMDDILETVRLDGQRSLHIGKLADQTIIENEMEHLGLDGYFLFEASEEPASKGITIIAKVCSLGSGIPTRTSHSYGCLAAIPEDHLLCDLERSVNRPAIRKLGSLRGSTRTTPLCRTSYNEQVHLAAPK